MLSYHVNILHSAFYDIRDIYKNVNVIHNKRDIDSLI